MIVVIGIGPGNASLLTSEVIDFITSCKCLIGTERQLQTVQQIPTQADRQIYNGKLEVLFEYIRQSLDVYGEVGILASGDPSFYGITEWVKRSFSQTPLKSLMGISSAQALFNALKMPMHDVFFTSVHGRDPNWDLMKHLEKICMLTDSAWSPNKIAEKYLAMGLNPMFHIGENLTYADECITSCRASDLPDKNYKMSVVVIENER